jgi:hypothetical protein
MAILRVPKDVTLVEERVDMSILRVCKDVTLLFLRLYSGLDVVLITHRIQRPYQRKSRAISLLPLSPFVVCCRVYLTFAGHEGI